MVKDDCRHSSRGGHIADFGKYLSALCTRPVWVHHWRKKHAIGEVIIVRYADDSAIGFQYQREAERFLQELRKRMAKFGLELHNEKTRLIEFGRHAEANRAARGEGKPETFDFLGFTHICATTRKNKRFTVRRKTIAKRLRGKAKAVREEIMRRRHDPVPEQGKWLRSVVQGHFNYYAVPSNKPGYYRNRRKNCTGRN